MAPCVPLYLPLLHAVQVVPPWGLQKPVGQQIPAPALLYVFVLQVVHVDDLRPLHLPAGQLISPLQSQYLPAAQSSQPALSPLQTRLLQP